MARTYTKLIYHIVFSTKERIPLISLEIRGRLVRSGRDLHFWRAEEAPPVGAGT